MHDDIGYSKEVGGGSFCSERNGYCQVLLRCSYTYITHGKCSAPQLGATGLIGSRLVAKLAYQKCKVKVLTRNASQARSKLPYPGVTFHETNSWNSAICGCDAVVNLAGEPIATR